MQTDLNAIQTVAYEDRVHSASAPGMKLMADTPISLRHSFGVKTRNQLISQQATQIASFCQLPDEILSYTLILSVCL
jgi:hypothetical protein